MSIRHSPQAAEAWAKDQFLLPDLVRTGWSRVLPHRLFGLLTSIAFVATQGLTGELMWGEIRDFHDGTKHDSDRSPRDRRFERFYGKSLPDSAEGLVDVLVDLGLVIRTHEHGEDVLDVPLPVPLAEEKLNLSRRERIMQAGIRYSLPIERAESAVLSVLDEQAEDGPYRTTLHRLATLTRHPVTLLREALASLIKQGDITMSRPPATLRDDARFLLTANWDHINEHRLTIVSDD